MFDKGGKSRNHREANPLNYGRQRTRGKYDLKILEARQDKTEPTRTVEYIV